MRLDESTPLDTFPCHVAPGSGWKEATSPHGPCLVPTRPRDASIRMQIVEKDLQEGGKRRQKRTCARPTDSTRRRRIWEMRCASTHVDCVTVGGVPSPHKVLTKIQSLHRVMLLAAIRLSPHAFARR